MPLMKPWTHLDGEFLVLVRQDSVRVHTVLESVVGRMKCKRQSTGTSWLVCNPEGLAEL